MINMINNVTRKGFATMQVFVFASALIMMGLVLFFGVQGVGIIQNRSCDIGIADFSDSLEGSVKKLSRDFSSTTRLELILPCSATTLCIADADYMGPSADSTIQQLRDNSVIASRSYEQGVANVFIIEDKQIIHQLNIPEVAVNYNGESVFCIEQSPVALQLEGVARKTLVSPWLP